MILGCNLRLIQDIEVRRALLGLTSTQEYPKTPNHFQDLLAVDDFQLMHRHQLMHPAIAAIDLDRSWWAGSQAMRMTNLWMQLGMQFCDRSD